MADKLCRFIPRIAGQIPCSSRDDLPNPCSLNFISIHCITYNNDKYDNNNTVFTYNKD